MAKKNHKRVKHDYSKYESYWNGARIPANDEKYYGLHRDGNRVKIDIKRMKKVGDLDIPKTVFDVASSIPRNTTYFLPKRLHRHDYVINQFRDKLKELKASWHEYKRAFSNITTPKDACDAVRTESLMSGIWDYDEASTMGVFAEMKRVPTYQKLWVSQCAQFIQQIATELMALMLRKCRYLGFSEKNVSRGKMHTYLHGHNGKSTVNDLEGFDVYNKFFTVYNLIKHNSEELFDEVKKNYPDMLLTDTYRNGEMSQYYLKIGDDYIEEMLDNLIKFYEALCEVFFDENVEYAEWNYDDYFIEKVHETIEFINNPLGGI